MESSFFVLCTLIAVVAVFVGLCKTLLSFSFTVFYLKKKIFLRHKDIIDYEIYLHKNPYYQKLSVEGKKKFILRVVNFIQHKDFIGREGLILTDEMKVLVAASAVQITFGLKEYRLFNYDRILLYPKSFYSRLMNLHMKGGTSTGGTIALSWKDFQEGYEDPDDKYNLGLHEMAHALKLDALNGDEFDDQFESYLEDWDAVGNVEFRKMKAGNSSFLRAYAGTNMHEFFAVCIEHFFEAPEGFKKNLPNLFNHLCFLLNQDPLNADNDYSLRENFVALANATPGSMPIPVRVFGNYTQEEMTSLAWKIGLGILILLWIIYS